MHSIGCYCLLARNLIRGYTGNIQRTPLNRFHISPFMTREKPGAPHRWAIIDLSFPKGGVIDSNINKDSYFGTDFILTLPSIDLITDKVHLDV